MPRPRSHIRWPADIPRRHRLKLNTGHGSFSRRRLVAAEDGFEDREIEIEVCLLLWVTRGKAILERENEVLLIGENDGCLITPGRFRLTEISVPPVSYVETCAYFFNDRVIKDVVDGEDFFRTLSMLISAPDVGLFPLPRLGQFISSWHHLTKGNPFTDFHELFTVMIPRFPAVPGFLKYQYYLPRGELPGWEPLGIPLCRDQGFPGDDTFLFEPAKRGEIKWADGLPVCVEIVVVLWFVGDLESFLGNQVTECPPIRDLGVLHRGRVVNHSGMLELVEDPSLEGAYFLIRLLVIPSVHFVSKV